MGYVHVLCVHCTVMTVKVKASHEKLVLYGTCTCVSMCSHLMVVNVVLKDNIPYILYMYSYVHWLFGKQHWYIGDAQTCQPMMVQEWV